MTDTLREKIREDFANGKLSKAEFDQLMREAAHFDKREGVVQPKAKRVKPKSRGQRWAEAAANAAAALSDLQDIQSEFEAWRDNLPENLQNSALGEKLQTVCDLDISSALDTANEAEAAELPLGFGRD